MKRPGIYLVVLALLLGILYIFQGVIFQGVKDQPKDLFEQEASNAQNLPTAQQPQESLNPTQSAQQSQNAETTTESGSPANLDAPDEHGTYDSKEDVSLYIKYYGKLPDNYITKQEAQDLGWKGGSVEEYAPGKCIGGNRFGNYEGLLPSKEGRIYTECDIDTLGAKNRGAKRIVYSNDGLIYYTDDHYESFILLYGEDE